MELTSMSTILVRVSLICHHFHGLLLHFLPKKLASFLFPSWLIILLPPSAVAAASKLLDPVASDSSFVAPSLTSRALARLQARPGTMDQSATELKRVFQMFDRNGDGRITKQELNESLENLGIYIPGEELGAMIEKIDVNGDGCVDIEEFGTLYQSIMDERDEEDMREAFNVFDQNGDEFITVEELRSVLASLGLKQGRTVEDCRKMISKVDVDGDGMMDFKEFKQMMKGGGFAALS